MAKTSLIITSTDQLGKGLQKTVTDVNPDATSAQLVTFATKLNALTTNSYVRTDRVDKTNCDTEASGKQTPTFTISKTTFTKAELSASNVTSTITTNSDGQLWVGKYQSSSASSPIDSGFAAGFAWDSSNPKQLWIVTPSGAVPQAGTFVVGVFETETYKAAEITVTITE